MRIMMLGWEFPPFIAGGLGTACYGLTKALDRLGHRVTFVLPRPVDRSKASHISLISPDSVPTAMVGGDGRHGASEAARSGRGGMATAGDGGATFSMEGFEHTTFRSVNAAFSSPYPGFAQPFGDGVSADGERLLIEGVDAFADLDSESGEAIDLAMGRPARGGEGGGQSMGRGGAGAAYEGDMIVNADRYARLVVSVARRDQFEVIHAHDWMTFPAALALGRVSGRPVVVHVHSTEFDRSGENINQRVYDIERRGMHGAARVLAVSELTKSICIKRYGVDPARVSVVYNGIDSEGAQPQPDDGLERKDKIVLFLGRITMQKGPEYFIRAAKRVLEKVPEAKFVVAGSGDMAVRMIEEAAHLGIGHRVLFAGFLRGAEVDRVYQMADCYVMPSVSEPFGIAPLEAMRNDVPVIISKQSGVAEVLTHALKVDFWDIDEMANKIVAVLRHAPLAETLREHGAFELRRLTWDGAATKCVQNYERAIPVLQGAGR